MNDCLIRIEQILDGKPYREYKLFHYGHFMNEINLIRGNYEITQIFAAIKNGKTLSILVKY